MRADSSRIPVPRTASAHVPDPGAVHEHLVVGVDGSPASVGALAWALRYALDNDCTVEVITAWPLGEAVLVHEVPGHFCEARWKAVQAQAEALAHATSLVGDAPPYVSRLANASALDALVGAAASGSTIVLGSDRAQPGRGEDAVRPVGIPLTVRVQRSATCPVLLIPHESAPLVSARDHQLIGGRS